MGRGKLDYAADLSRPKTSSRVTQLDGLRGVAALVVVLCHTLATIPALGIVFGDRFAPFSSLEYLFIYSPLHMLWNGTAAVYVFFVLSGFVLVLPFVRDGKRPAWLPYYVKRGLRLYLPVWASLAFAAMLILLVPRINSPIQSWWANWFAIDLTGSELVHDAILVLGTGGINTALWSLRWEVIFSVLLPVYVLYASVLRRLWVIKLVAPIALVGVGTALGSGWLTYLPIFAIGAIIGVERNRIRALVSRFSQRAWPLVALVSLLLLNADWVRPTPLTGSNVITTVGATLCVVVFLGWAPAITFGDTTIVQWLGRISFSLYLVHAPIILASVALIGPTSLTLALVVAVVVSIGFAEIFHRFIEIPSHHLAIRAGGAVSTLQSRISAKATPSSTPDRV